VNIFVRVLGDVETRTRFQLAATTMDARTRAVIVHYGQLLATRIQAHASGRPGPNAPTGDYRRSIHAKPFGAGSVFGVRVGTNKPQGRRLEFGFVGADSLGRVYNQPPYPHFGPAVHEIEPPFKSALAEIAGSI
jgi:hypothetical protein